MKTREKKSSLVSLEGTREIMTIQDLEKAYTLVQEIKLLPLRKYSFDPDTGKYVVLLYHSAKHEFESESEAIQFLYNSSCQLSGLFQAANQVYLKAINLSQPGAFKLSHKDYLKYTQLRAEIDKVFYFNAYLYAGHSNHVFYKNTVLIMERLLALVATVRKIPGIDQEINSIEATIKEPLTRIEAVKDFHFNNIIHSLKISNNGNQRFDKRISSI